MNPVKMSLLGNRYLVELHKPDAAGLVLTEQTKADQFRGTLAAIGDQVQGARVLVGQTVMLSNYGGQAYQEDGREFKIVAAEDVIAILPTEAH